jgi:hypothetical protein
MQVARHASRHDARLLIDGLKPPPCFNGIVEKGFLSREAKALDGLELPVMVQ